ncbi:hypothetical protein [Desulfurivibrio dismutans]|uniref:hypothetical protein n=1 Tax=Desulfurivibrio dismutans TaxID=1398908 RepID=UPI0023D9C50D|nr:hypothetical protein [Desulfurivibrio alkaliphilus]MDF1615817.1 hypothetical protein [Desulfurivibrio alkaliphilus]
MPCFFARAVESEYLSPSPPYHHHLSPSPSYSNPPYYPPPAGLAPDALVIIWGAGETYPPKYRYSLAKKFTRSEKIYSFQTHVGIFLPREQPAEVRPVPGSAPGY